MNNSLNVRYRIMVTATAMMGRTHFGHLVTKAKNIIPINKALA